MAGSTGIGVPVSGSDKAMDEELIPMKVEEARIYRALSARLNYMALDRPDLGYAANLAARSMAIPKEGDMTILKKVARYLARSHRCSLAFRRQSKVELHSTKRTACTKTLNAFNCVRQLAIHTLP